jgi:hypothetical protein
MTNIRTPIGFLSAPAGSVAGRLGYGAMLLAGNATGGAPAVVTESPCSSQSPAPVSGRRMPGRGLVGNVKSGYSHQEVRQWETRISPAPVLT